MSLMNITHKIIRNLSKVIEPVFCGTYHQSIQTRRSQRILYSQHIQQSSKKRFIQTSTLCNAKDSVTITFIDRTGTKINVEAEVGDTLLDVAKDYDIDGVEGACGGTLACSTCHCIFKEDDFERLELEDISEEELDMLDLAYGLTDTSRLVCAIDITEEMDGLEISVPTSTRDARGEDS